MRPDDFDLLDMIRSAERAAEATSRYAWSSEGRRALASKLCGAQTSHLVAIAGRPIENVYSSSYT